MRIQSIEIRDTFGTAHMRFQPGTVTRIHGANGSGKSSILRALAYVFDGGTDPSVIRKGAEESKIELALDDGTTILKRTRPKRSRKGGEIVGYTIDLEVTQPDGRPRGAPQGYINELAESLAMDPSILLRMDVTTAPGRQKLAAELMRLVPISFPPEDVRAASAYPASRTDAEPAMDASLGVIQGPMSIDDLKSYVADVREERRRVGVIRDQCDGSIERLLKSLPPTGAPISPETLRAIEEARLALEKQAGDEKVSIERQSQTAMQQAKTQHAAAVLAADKAYSEALAVIEKQRVEAIAAANMEMSRQKQEIVSLTSEELAAMESRLAPQRQRLAEDHAVAKERMEAQGRAQWGRQEIEKQEATRAENSWRYDQLSAVIDRLDRLKAEKLKRLPVDGLIVEDGAAYIDDGDGKGPVEWHNCNLSRRVEAVLQICAQRAGRLPFLIIDDFEHVQPSTRKALEDGLIGCGFQIIEALVREDEGPLVIEVQEGGVDARTDAAHIAG